MFQKGTPKIVPASSTEAYDDLFTAFDEGVRSPQLFADLSLPRLDAKSRGGPLRKIRDLKFAGFDDSRPENHSSTQMVLTWAGRKIEGIIGAEILHAVKGESNVMVKVLSADLPETVPSKFFEVDLLLGSRDQPTGIGEIKCVFGNMKASRRQMGRKKTIVARVLSPEFPTLKFWGVYIDFNPYPDESAHLEIARRKDAPLVAFEKLKSLIQDAEVASSANDGELRATSTFRIDGRALLGDLKSRGLVPDRLWEVVRQVRESLHPGS